MNWRVMARLKQVLYVTYVHIAPNSNEWLINEQVVKYKLIILQFKY